MFGPESHMTAIVGMALGHRPIPKAPKPEPQLSQNLLGKNVRFSVVAGKNFNVFIRTPTQTINSCSMHIM